MERRERVNGKSGSCTGRTELIESQELIFFTVDFFLSVSAPRREKGFMGVLELNGRDRVFVAGGRGMVGGAICRALDKAGHEDVLAPGRDALDLGDQAAVDAWFAENRPDQVFLAAARVGGIHANNAYPAEFIHDNLVIETNVIHSAWKHGAKKLCFLGSSCIYPKHAPQPMKEEHLLTGELEPTNEWYAIAKIAGIKMCQAYRRQYGFDAISLMPTNLYGPGDNFHPENSHVLPALIRRFQEAKEAGRRRSRSGVPEHRNGSSCTSTTWPTPASF